MDDETEPWTDDEVDAYIRQRSRLRSVVTALPVLACGFMLWRSWASFDRTFLVGTTSMFLGVVFAFAAVRSKPRAPSALAALALLGIAGLGPRSCASGFDRIEAEFSPVIAALDEHYSEHGTYPIDLDELVPNYLGGLPACDPEGDPPVYLAIEVDDEPRFMITCYTWVHWKYSYRSEDEEWVGWD